MVGGSNPSLPVFLSNIYNYIKMLNLIWYCYKNLVEFKWNLYIESIDVYTFVFLSLIDWINVYFFGCLHILTGLFGFYVLDKFDLGVFEYFIFYSFWNTYFYISSRKVLGWVYFSYYWVVLMIGYVFSSLVGLILFSDEVNPFYFFFRI